MTDKPSLIGAAVTVTTNLNTQTNYNVVGEGLCSDQSNTLIFGLGNAKTIKSIVIKKSNGIIKTLKNSTINSTIIVSE